MASFFKKLVEHRSKSPQKRVVSSSSSFENGTQLAYVRRDNGPPYAPVCLLPLPPSPTPYYNSKNGSNHSNESFGIHSWNTEPREVDEVRTKVESPTNPGPLMRTRSHSPRKNRQENSDNRRIKSKSKSPQKGSSVAIINQLDYLNSQCHLEGCRADIVVHSTRFLLCRHQLCHASMFFKDLLTQQDTKEFHISVSSMKEPSPSTQFRWFVESSIPCPALKDITDETLETCMRLAKRFQAKGLELRCVKYLLENCCNRQPIVVLCWLNWALKHGFDAQTQMALLPSVARLSLNALERHRHMLTEKIYSDIVTAKLRGTFDKTVQVFLAIHGLDHFSTEAEICPRCRRTKEGMKIKVFCDPCRKQIGCDRCYHDGCEIAARSVEDMQAFFKCPHKLSPLNDSTDDCHCQIPSLAQYLGMHHNLRYRENSDEYMSPSSDLTTRGRKREPKNHT